MPEKTDLDKLQLLFRGGDHGFGWSIDLRDDGGNLVRDENGKVKSKAKKWEPHSPKDEDYRLHLDGIRRLGRVPIRPESQSLFFAAFESDVYPGDPNYRTLEYWRERCRKLEVPANVELSKSGGITFWFFFEHPRLASAVRRVLRHWMVSVLALPESTEIFPKQDEIHPHETADGWKDVGSWIHLPWFGQPVPDSISYADAAFDALIKPASAPPIEKTLSTNGAVKLPKVKRGVNFAEELAKVVKFQTLNMADGIVAFNYHGLPGKDNRPQPCLVQGTIHRDHAGDARQSCFWLHPDGGLEHKCFDSDCQSKDEGVGRGRLALRALGIESRVFDVIDGSDWREHCWSLGQLPKDPPKYLIDLLVPEKALTMIPAPSYNCKTWFALQAAWAQAQGKALFDHFKVSSEPVPQLYCVPEMNASWVYNYAQKIGIIESELFLFRPMELEPWSLKDKRMLAAAQGRHVTLDTTGYFNPTDDTNSYSQSLRFAELVYNILNNDSRGVTGLYHPPKYSKEEFLWTLENSLLGSAGYGGMLRSCLRMRNLNTDLNDPNVWVYVQGLKNPGLKPFQLESIPLKMRVKPGDSPYLKELLSGDVKGPEQLMAEELFAKNLSIRAIQAELREKGYSKSTSVGKIQKWHDDWKKEKKEEQEALSFGGVSL